MILSTFPNITDSKSQTTNKEGQRFPLTGTVDQIGNDIKRIKDIGIDHIIILPLVQFCPLLLNGIFS
jgi:hypothetical protein